MATGIVESPQVGEAEGTHVAEVSANPEEFATQNAGEEIVNSETTEVVKDTISENASDDAKPKKKKKTKKSTASAAPLVEPEIIPESPYVNIVNKKLRAIKKKLEKVKEIETKLSEGKVLNEQQLEALSKKSDLQKVQQELDAVRQQMQDFHNQEFKAKKDATATPEEYAFAAPSQATPVILADQVSEKEQQTDAVQEDAHSTDSKSDFSDNIKNLLRLLHAVSLWQALGKDVPSPLNFFRKVLLGSTRPPLESSFTVNLEESVAEAKKYLARDDREVAHGMNYAQLAEAVDKMIEEVEGKVSRTSEKQEESFQFFADLVGSNVTHSPSRLPAILGTTVATGPEAVQEKSKDVSTLEEPSAKVQAEDVVSQSSSGEADSGDQKENVDTGNEEAAFASADRKRLDNRQGGRAQGGRGGRSRSYRSGAHRGGEREGQEGAKTFEAKGEHQYRERRPRGPPGERNSQNNGQGHGNGEQRRPPRYDRRQNGPNAGNKGQRNGTYQPKAENHSSGAITTPESAPVPAAH